jgi:predicted transcriptional regulator
VVVGLIATVSPSPCRAQPTTLIRFEIADQFDRRHADADLRGRLLLVVGADQTGSRYQGPWVDGLRDAVQTLTAEDEAQVVEAADLRGVPFFVRGSVKRRFPSDRRSWVLMDWRGVFARAYRFEPKKCNILVFDRSGKLVYRTAVQDLDRAVLAEILATIAARVTDHD